jgi:hypothetical protein
LELWGSVSASSRLPSPWRLSLISSPLPHISEEGRRLTAVLVAVATLWIGEVYRSR